MDISTQGPVRILPSATVISEAQTRNEIKIPIGCHFSSISPDLDWVIYSCRDKLWLTRSAQPSEATLIIQDDHIRATSWSPDGSEFVVGTGYLDQANNYVASLWASRWKIPSERRLLYQGNFDCDRQLWSPNGKWILVTGGSGKSGAAILIRTDGTGRQDTRTSIGIMEWWHAANWSPDGTRLAYASDNRFPHPTEIQVLDVDSGTTTLFYTRTESILVPAWSPDGKGIALLVRSSPEELVILESSTKRILSRFGLPSRWKEVYDLFWSPNNDRIAVSFDPFGRQIGVISLPGGEVSEFADEKASSVLGWTRDGKSLIILGEKGDQEAIWIMPVK
jgi:Tol biopolymer transport system component